MSPRADEHEGELNDTDAKRAKDRVEARALQIMRGDIANLTEQGAFLRYIGRHIYPALVQNFPVNSGSELAKFMGKREFALQIINDMDTDHPGFIARLLAARFDYERELELAASPRKEK